jgi:hypothetical protein
MSVEWQPGLSLAEIEKMVIQKALRFYQGNKEQTARALGVSTKTIYNKVEFYEGRAKSADEEVEQVHVPTPVPLHNHVPKEHRVSAKKGK